MATSAPTVGDEAPPFELYTHENDVWRLSDHRGRPVVLLFFPGAFTPVCTSELNTVSNDLGSYAPASVVGISTDAPFVLKEFHSVHELDFPLLSDHDAEVCLNYGAKYQNNFTPMNLDRIAKRAAFLIDGEGIVQYAEVLDDAGMQPDFEAIQRTLRALSP